jgi:hypothetical protein
MEDAGSAERRRALRVGLLAAVLFVLLAIVAFASRTGYGHHSHVARPTPGYVSWAMSVFLVIFVLLIPFAVWAQVSQRRLEQRTQRSFQARVVRGLVALVAAMILGAVVAWLRRTGHFPTLSSLGFGGGSGSAGGHGKNGNTASYSPTFQWPVLWATLGVLVVGGAAFWWWWRRQRAALDVLEAAEPTVAENVAASISDTIDDLEAEPDARRAVVAAYARMEVTFARNGLDRRPSETPIEYLRRILLGLTSRGDAVQRLTSLFEQAKFSTHVIDANMKHDAIRSLQVIRDDLQGAAA